MECQATAGVGFDLDHTLAIDNKLERVAFLRLLEEVVERGGHPLGSIFEESDRIDALLAEQRTGAFPIEIAVERFVIDRGLPMEPYFLERYRALALEMIEQFVVPMPGVRRTLAELQRRGIPVAVLSNGWNPLQLLKARRAGFGGVVLASADIGAQKPSARAFEVLMDELGTRPETTWFVGDDPHSDVSGAREFGLHAVWLDDEGRRYPPEILPPSYRIGRLEELLEILPETASALR
ncbi:MAG TPA: HAD family hydrolase [Candidatus Acidoferrales bacterium]|nr:HAD family hydrolase [Candidatus Acidoferrales bacterium]